MNKFVDFFFERKLNPNRVVNNSLGEYQDGTSIDEVSRTFFEVI